MKKDELKTLILEILLNEFEINISKNFICTNYNKYILDVQFKNEILNVSYDFQHMNIYAIKNIFQKIYYLIYILQNVLMPHLWLMVMKINTKKLILKHYQSFILIFLVQFKILY